MCQGVRVYCTGCGAVRAQSSLPVSSEQGFCVWGAARSHAQKVKRLPTLRGGPHAAAAPDTLADLLGTRAERVPDCSSYLSRITWIPRGLSAPASASPASLNASAAGEFATSTEVHNASSQRTSTEAQTPIKRQRC